MELNSQTRSWAFILGYGSYLFFMFYLGLMYAPGFSPHTSSPAVILSGSSAVLSFFCCFAAVVIAIYSMLRRGLSWDSLVSLLLALPLFLFFSFVVLVALSGGV